VFCGNIEIYIYEIRIHADWLRHKIIALCHHHDYECCKYLYILLVVAFLFLLAAFNPFNSGTPSITLLAELLWLENAVIFLNIVDRALLHRPL
jgi:hypothetical protein